MTKEFIKLQGISKKFNKGNINVLKNINYTFKKGLTYSIIGPSGSGKSTLLNLLSLVDRPTSGKIKMNNSRIDFNDYDYNDTLRGKKIGIIYQDRNLLTDFTALENIYLPSLLINNNEQKAMKEAKKLIKNVGLIKRSNHYPSELSGGEAQRIAIARALINSPEIILADEPTGNLDNRNSQSIFNIILKLKNKNRIIIYATHNMHFAKMADCKLQLSNGIIKKYHATRKE